MSNKTQQNYSVSILIQVMNELWYAEVNTPEHVYRKQTGKGIYGISIPY